MYAKLQSTATECSCCASCVLKGWNWELSAADASGSTPPGKYLTYYLTYATSERPDDRKLCEELEL